MSFRRSVPAACANIVGDSLLAVSLTMAKRGGVPDGGSGPNRHGKGDINNKGRGGDRGGMSGGGDDDFSLDTQAIAEDGKEAGKRKQVALEEDTVSLWRLARDLALLETVTFENEANRGELLEEHPSTLSSIVSLLSRFSLESGGGGGASRAVGAAGGRRGDGGGDGELGDMGGKGGKGAAARGGINVDDGVIVNEESDAIGDCGDQERGERHKCILVG